MEGLTEVSRQLNAVLPHQHIPHLLSTFSLSQGLLLKLTDRLCWLALESWGSCWLHISSARMTGASCHTRFIFTCLLGNQNQVPALIWQESTN